MNDKLTRARSELRDMETLAAQSSPVHSLHPLAKLLVTILYIVTVVSFPKYDLSALVVMVLYPAFLYQLAGISVGLCFHRLRYVLPLVCAVGLVNPFLDREPIMRLGSLLVSGGVVSMLTLMLKGVFALMASFLLIATTSIDSLCAALRRLHVPSLITTLLLLTYRYVGVMLEEASVMADAYKLRAPGQNGIRFNAWGSFIGQLLLRSMDRAEELYGSMQLRGFRGEFYYAAVRPFRAADALFTVGVSAAVLCARYFDIAALVGGLFVR